MINQTKNLIFRFLLTLFLVGIYAIGFSLHTVVAAEMNVKEDVQVTNGVRYKDADIPGPNAVRVMEIDMVNRYTKVELGFPPAFDRLLRTTTQALGYNQEGRTVIGAINGGFFHLDSKKPMNLISKNGQIVYQGDVSTSKNSFVNEPIAFGISRDGKGIIDYYQLDLDFTYNGKTNPITGINKPRTEKSVNVYTSDFYSKYTETNEYGIEVVVALDTKPVLGSTYKGKVTAIRGYGDKTKTKIPKNGFVLSAHRETWDSVKSLETGDSVTLSIDIDDKWKGSSFMLGSGPLLVKDGKVNLSMNPDSWRATEVAPRTAVAIDKTGEKVFFITVDGRQPGYSKGMNLTELAKLAVSKGADRALNLDGGGSTTMAVRSSGNSGLKVANSPSDGFERGISTMLMAVSTEPQYYTDVNLWDSHKNGIYWLTAKGIKGYENGTFGVDKGLARPHAAIMFSRALGLDIPDAAKVEDFFKDVNGDDQYAEFIAAMGESGVFKGSNNMFMPEKKLTREQMASTLVNAFGLQSKGEKVKINVKNVSATHKKSVQILADLGITNQVDNFRPSETVTRGQFATFLYLSQKK